MKELHILLIEDDNDDIELVQDALKENEVPNKMDVIKDGGAVSAYLEEMVVVPDIIVMDLNVPKVHGRDVLKNIRRTDRLTNVPIVILTTSSSQNDIDYCYKEGASTYLIKPVTTDGFKVVVKTITDLAN